MMRLHQIPAAVRAALAGCTLFLAASTVRADEKPQAADAAVVVDGVASHPRLDLTAGVRLDQAYDSNVYNGRGPDFVTRLSPHLAMDVVGRRGDLKLSYDVGLWNYLEGKAHSSINHRAIGAGTVRLARRVDLRIADEFVRAQDPAFLTRAGVVAPQTGITDNIADGMLAMRFTRRLDGALGYSYRITRFDPTPIVRLHDGDQHDANGALSWRATRSDDLRFGYRFQYFTADATGLATTNSPALGWRHALTRDLELRAEAGPVYYGGLATNSSAWTWRGHGVLRYYTPTWRAAASYVHDLVGGTGAATVLWADYVYGQLGYHFAERFDLHGGVGWFSNGLAPSGATLYEGMNVDVIADLSILHNLRLAAYYTFYWQETVAAAAAALPLVPITRNIVGLRLYAVIGAEATPPRREVNP